MASLRTSRLGSRRQWGFKEDFAIWATSSSTPRFDIVTTGFACQRRSTEAKGTVLIPFGFQYPSMHEVYKSIYSKPW